VKRRKGSKK